MTEEQELMWDRLNRVSDPMNHAIELAILIARHYNMTFKDAMALPLSETYKLLEEMRVI